MRSCSTAAAVSLQGETSSANETVDVDVDQTPSGFAVGCAEDYAGGFAGSSGDGEEFSHGLRDFTVELLGDDAACALDGLGFVVIEASGADDAILWLRAGAWLIAFGVG